MSATSPFAPVLVRPAGPPGGAPVVLDDAQARVVAHRRGQGPLVVLGAPGTGRTTTLVEAVVARVERDGLDPSRVMLLAPTRRAAAALRDRVTARLDRTLTEPLARTPHALAFALLRRAAVHAGEPVPRLLSGPEQDRILADLLAGHAAGEGTAPGWPEDVLPALGLRGFRDELRDLLMRALERGLGPEDLADLGRRTGRPEWAAAGRVLAEYLDVTALASPGAFDPAAIVETAAALLEDDAELLAAERARWQLVAVDDHHESTAATASLLDRLCGPGADLLLVGDPDATTQSFRGGEPRLLVEAPERYRRADGAAAPTVVLRTRWRCGAAVAAVADRVAAGIGASGTTRQRRPSPGAGGAGEVSAHVLRSATQEAAYVASVLRAEHLFSGTPWGAMAVVVRSGAATAALRRGLAAAGVPVAVPAAEVPVRDEPAVLPLRIALRAVLDAESLDADAAVTLVTSPLGGADALALRRLRQALRAEERAGGGGRASDALLVEALGDPARVASLDRRIAEPARRVAEVLAAGRAAVAAVGATAETVLWALWSASGLAEPWRRQALAGGPAGARADRDLDAVVALFDAAARYVDRLPQMGPRAFLDHLDAQDVPADTLAERAPDSGAVALVTAQGAAGREWDVVVVAGLQDGAWPDTRLRGSLLGSADLVDVLSGRDTGDAAAAHRQVLDDERRLLHVAVTRARRRLVATAVRDEDERPSAFLDLVDPPDDDAPEERPFTSVPRPVSLPGLVAELRQVLLTPGEPRQEQAAAALARLAAAGVPGAHPDDWYGLAEVTDDGPLRGPEEPVVVSPSRVESFLRCGLRWLLETSGGTAGDSAAQGVGNLVHEVVAQRPDAELAELTAALDAQWASLGLPAGWVGERERARAHRMLARYTDYVRTSGRELVGVEVDVDAQVGRAVVRGRVDRLERDAAGRLVVVDLKTTKSPPKDADVPQNPQLGVYQVAVEAGGAEVSGGAVLVQLGSKNLRLKVQGQPPLADADDPAWAAELLERAADGMAGRDFAATASELCRVCPVAVTCPLQQAGRQVGA